MRNSWLRATALTLAVCASAAARQGPLVRQDDSGDPCRRFKMRVLVPAELAGQRLRPKGTAADIDQKMVRDPCRAAAEAHTASVSAVARSQEFRMPMTLLLA
jgi:hypothetical protein